MEKRERGGKEGNILCDVETISTNAGNERRNGQSKSTGRISGPGKAIKPDMNGLIKK